MVSGWGVSRNLRVNGGPEMLLHRWHVSVAAGCALIAAMVWVMSGCSGDSAPLRSSPQVRLVERPALAKPASGDGSLTISKYVSRWAGGTLIIDDPAVGRTTFVVPPGAVRSDVTITMRVRTVGPVEADFEPEGLRFLKPAALTLSYRGASLSGTEPAKLGLYYYNPSTSAWEYVPGSIPEATSFMVAAPIMHFSQYAVGSVE